MRHGPIFRPELYLGKGINEKNVAKIKRKLVRKPLFSDVVLISLSCNFSDQLEIYDAKQLAQRFYRNNPPYVVGIAGSREEAFSVVIEIVQECLQVRGDCELKEYLRC
jgi:hypothetical protein